MDDQSLWKKELSFGRKSKGKKDGDDSPASDEKPTSMWKKELSFKRKPKADVVEGDVAADTPVSEEPVSGELPAAEPEVTEEPVGENEVSFSQRISSYGRSVQAERSSRTKSLRPRISLLPASSRRPRRTSGRRRFRSAASRRRSLWPRSP